MSLAVYIYNVISIIALVDLLYCKYQMHKDKYLIKWMGLSSLFKAKLIVETFISFVYIMYLMVNLVFLLIKIF